MFESVVLHGGGGTLLWWYRPAAVLRGWRITKKKDSKSWVLTATAESVDHFTIGRKPLIFTAPRDKGAWCWTVLDVSVQNGHVVAELGPPEQ